jgi:hypothetical protein
LDALKVVESLKGKNGGRQWEAATVFYVLKRIAAARMISA